MKSGGAKKRARLARRLAHHKAVQNLVRTRNSFMPKQRTEKASATFKDSDRNQIATHSFWSRIMGRRG